MEMKTSGWGQDFGAWKISVYGLWQPGETHPGGEELSLVISVKCSVQIKPSLLCFVPIVYSTLQNVREAQLLTAWILICLITKSLLIWLCNKIFKALYLVRRNDFVSQWYRCKAVGVFYEHLILFKYIIWNTKQSLFFRCLARLCTFFKSRHIAF